MAKVRINIDLPNDKKEEIRNISISSGFESMKEFFMFSVFIVKFIIDKRREGKKFGMMNKDGKFEIICMPFIENSIKK